MSLPPGARLGVFEVVGALGAGGMGEVYRARDTRLDREVALKILPDAFALDAERLARFEREAKTLASLNHPLIAHVHGLEEADGVRALVMELVEGDDLSRRIAGGPMPLDEALPIARQIAEALEAAHQAGIIHRDLKPANIKVRPDGTVKILDFGLAKAVDGGAGDSASANVMNSPTITTPAMTLRGVILGTAAYMAPEQAKGRAIDKRADLWAFGCVLFEMLTGKRAFDGDDMSEVMAAVIKSEPDWTAMPANVPSHIQLLVRRCLEKDPRKRVGDAAVARFVLNETLGGSVVDSPKAGRGRRWPVLAGALVALALLAATVWAATRMTASVPEPMRLAIVPSESQPLFNQANDADLAVSPDGRHVVYRSRIGLVAKLVVRDINQIEGRVLDGTDGARTPFFSPDGKWLAFFTQAALKKVAITGGSAQTICPITGSPRGATWHGDTIVFATSDATIGLQRVSAAGGSPVALTKLDTKGAAEALVAGNWYPSFLPDGRRVLFSAVERGQDAPATGVFDLQTQEQRVVLRGGWQARYVSPGTLLFFDGSTLRAVPFDAGRAEVTGEPVPVLEGVCCPDGAADLALSDAGLLVYVSTGAAVGQAAAGRLIVWVDRTGREEALPGAHKLFTDPRVSPDGQQAIIEATDDADDIWTLDVARGALTRQTFEAGEDETSTWMPDGKTLVYASSRQDKPRTVFRRRADGAGAEESLWTGTQHVHVETVTADGRALILAVSEVNGSPPDLALLPLDGDHALKPLLQSKFGEAGARLSPDGRWLAYFSNETGRDEVYVRAFPSLEGKLQVSTGGGRQPVWSRKGDELFYRGEGAMMAVRVGPGSPLSVTAPRKLFEDRYYNKGLTHTGYDVSRDGRFLMVKDPAAGQVTGVGTVLPQTNFIVVLNWFEELQQKLHPR